MNGTVWKRGEAWPCFLWKKCVYVFHMFCLLSVPSEYIPEPEDYIWESYHLTGNTFSWFPFLFKIFVDLGQHTAYLFISYSSFILLLWQNNKNQLGGGKQIRFVWLIFPGCSSSLRKIRVGLVGAETEPFGKAACCPVSGPCFARFLIQPKSTWPGDAAAHSGMDLCKSINNQNNLPPANLI